MAANPTVPADLPSLFQSNESRSVLQSQPVNQYGYGSFYLASNSTTGTLYVILVICLDDAFKWS